MKHKSVRIVSVILYFLVLVVVAFYTGKTIPLALYGTHPHVFSVGTHYPFKPEQFPVVNSSEKPFVTAQAYSVIDTRTMTPIMEYNETVPRSPASIVKLAGALVALQKNEPTTVYTVKNVVTEPVAMGLVPGEKIALINLLYGSLINSANDAALTIAENYPGGEKAFVYEMNKLARKIGLRDTTFVNPIGFDDMQQQSTASDLAILGAYAMKNPLLRTITSTTAITVSDTTYRIFHPLVNSNELVGMIPGVGGAKTGKTQEAQENLLTYYLHEGKNPTIIVILGSQSRFEDTKNILTYLNANLRYVPFSSMYALDTAGR